MASIRNELARRGAAFNFVAVDLIDHKARSYLRRRRPAAGTRRRRRQGFRRIRARFRRPPCQARRPSGRVSALSRRCRRPSPRARAASRSMPNWRRATISIPSFPSWPLPRATGAGVLARRDGDDVLFLSGLPGDAERRAAPARELRRLGRADRPLHARRGRDHARDRSLGAAGVRRLARACREPAGRWSPASTKARRSPTKTISRASSDSP